MQKEIAENTGMNKRTICKALDSLTSNQILKVTRTIGKARLYRLDSGNLVVQDIKRIERRLSLAAANEED
jgi:DNA-binding transcriptional regulator YhcF (GntR family)